jgi:hypothetical protein
MIKIIIIFLISFTGIYAQFPIEINFNLHNDLKPENIFYFSFGINANAGDSVDFNLGETELPPYPFSSFYAAMEFTDSTKFIDDTTKYYDYIRSNKDFKGIPPDIDKFFIKYQLHILWYNSNKVTINWGSSPQNVNIDSIFIKDAFNGFLINQNMKTSNLLEITNQSVDNLYFYVYYTKSPNSVYEKLSNSSDYIYPNPVSDFIKIKNNMYSSFKIYDIYGNMIDMNSLINNQIDVSYLSKGIYLLYLNYYDGQINVCKFIKN